MGLIKFITAEMGPSTQKDEQPVKGTFTQRGFTQYQTHTEVYNLQNNKDKKDDTHSILLFSTFIDG